VEKIPLFVLAAGVSVVTLFAKQGVVASLEQAPFLSRLANGLTAYVTYLRQTFWPAGLAAYYPYFPDRASLWPAVSAAVFLAALTAACLGAARRWPYLAVGWLWYLGTLMPVIGLVQVGTYAHADRYTYIPLIGLFLLLVWGGADLLGYLRCPPALSASFVGLLLGACMLGTWLQVCTWHDSVTLWRHALDVTADNYLAHDNLGVALAKQGEGNEATVHFAEAVRLNPNFANGHYDLGVALETRGQTAQACEQYREAVRLNPGHALAQHNLGLALWKQGDRVEALTHLTEAGHLDPDFATAHYNLGVELEGRGRADLALEQYQVAVRLNPRHGRAHHNLGVVLWGRGELDEAARHYVAALEIDPNYASACHNLGVVRWQQGQHAEALRCYQRAVELRPDVARYHCSLAFALHEQGRREEAASHYQQALRLDPGWPQTFNRAAWVLATHPDPKVRDGATALLMAQQVCQAPGGRRPETLDTLAAALAENGRFEEAARTVQEAATLARADGRADLVAALEQRLQRYQARQPVRQEPAAAMPGAAPGTVR
jgi:Flp pilus assembly protein TadD